MNAELILPGKGGQTWNILKEGEGQPQNVKLKKERKKERKCKIYIIK